MQHKIEKTYMNTWKAALLGSAVRLFPDRITFAIDEACDVGKGQANAVVCMLLITAWAKTRTTP